jgi:peptide subunit release factor 1 (eRF1)
MRTETRPTQFVKYDENAGKVLTVVVNVDQSSSANRNREFEVPVNSKLREIEARIKDEAELSQYRFCADLSRQFIDSYQPRSKSVMVFTQANGSVITRELNVPLETEVCWQDLPHIRPLVEAGDEFKEILIVLMDGKQSRFLTSHLGIMTEHPGTVNPFPTSHTQAPGNDKTKSQASFHRKSDEKKHLYLKAAAEMAETIAATRSINRIVLAGNNGISKELYSLLPKTLQQHVISFEVLQAHATLGEISAVIAKPRYQAERENESAKVQTLLDRARSHAAAAVTGIADTTEALAEGRIHELLYAQGLTPSGAACSSCGRIVVTHLTCPKCQVEVGPLGDAMDLIIGAALDSGATIEQVRGKAAEALMAAGGIGAFLKY